MWCDEPPEDRVISIVAGCLANHDRAHSLLVQTYITGANGGDPVRPGDRTVTGGSESRSSSLVLPTLLALLLLVQTYITGAQ